MEMDKKSLPVFDVTGKEILQVGIVVRDVVKTAKRYSEIFGIGPWAFFDGGGSDYILHDQPRNVESALRMGFAKLGRLEIELLQPLYGPSTHMEFLQTRGEGVHHLSFDAVDNRREFVSALKGHGIEIEMEASVAGAYTATYMSTQKHLGTFFEALEVVSEEKYSQMTPWGIYEPKGPGIINMNGKEIVQVGIVTDSAERMAGHYEEIFGIDSWFFMDLKPPTAVGHNWHGVTLTENTDFLVRAAFGNIGNLQIELLEPVKGVGTHMDFLKTKGVGVHHISFDLIDDYREVVAALEKNGVGSEMNGQMEFEGETQIFNYLDTGQALGTILEVVGVIK
ncbi:MAG: VOC family protein [Deltaproteobacteria bacterium]|nr:VOC family protein [Deltaproteobacteria bacterium]